MSELTGGVEETTTIPLAEFNALSMDKYRLDALIRLNNYKLLSQGDAPKWSRDHIDWLLKNK